MEKRCYKRTLTLTIIHQVDGVDRDIIAQSVNTGASQDRCEGFFKQKGLGFREGGCWVEDCEFASSCHWDGYLL